MAEIRRTAVLPPSLFTLGNFLSHVSGKGGGGADKSMEVDGFRRNIRADFF